MVLQGKNGIGDCPIANVPRKHRNCPPGRTMSKAGTGILHVSGIPGSSNAEYMSSIFRAILFLSPMLMGYHSLRC